MSQNCPICHQSVEPRPRYPSYVCDSCIELASDECGQKVEYFNTHPMGFGCTAIYQNSNDKHYPTNKCFIGTTECRAVAGYFGGIIIQPLTAYQPRFQEERATDLLPQWWVKGAT